MSAQDQENLLPAPTTLPEMQSMAGDEIRRIEALRSGSDPPIAISKFMRLVIRLAAKVDWSEERALREFWYNPVKPMALRAFWEYDDTGKVSQTFNDYFAKKLSEYLSELVLKDSNDITYRALRVFDESRERNIRTTGLESDKLLFVEKKTAFRKLNPLADVYEISIISGGGFSATAAIEAIADDLDPATPYRLYVMSDYDPTGFDIVNDFRRRATQLGIQLLSVTRLGINPSQVDDQTISEQRFKPKVSSDNHEEWMDEYGIDGRYGLEIEATSGGTTGGRKLRQTVVDELRSEINERGRYEQELQRSARTISDNAAGMVVEDLIGPLRDQLHRGLRSHSKRIMYESEAIGEGFAVDLDTARSIDGTDPLLPSVPADGDLHKGAVDGESLAIKTTGESQAVYRRLLDGIRNGDIDLSEIENGEYSTQSDLPAFPVDLDEVLPDEDSLETDAETDSVLQVPRDTFYVVSLRDGIVLLSSQSVAISYILSSLREVARSDTVIDDAIVWVQDIDSYSVQATDSEWRADPIDTTAILKRVVREWEVPPDLDPDDDGPLTVTGSRFCVTEVSDSQYASDEFVAACELLGMALARGDPVDQLTVHTLITPGDQWEIKQHSREEVALGILRGEVLREEAR
jgi:hypothetical protein